MPGTGIFLGSLHIPGIFAGIQVFFRVIEQDFVQNHKVSRGFAPWTPMLMLNIGRFLHIVGSAGRLRSISPQSVFFGNLRYFLGVIIFLKCWPPVGLRWESPPWGTWMTPSSTLKFMSKIKVTGSI